MTTGQKVTMWIFGLIICFIIFISGLTTGPYGDATNPFIAFIIPLCLLGTMFFLSFKKKI